MTIHRRQFVRIAGAAATSLALPRIAAADTYPSRPVRILIATSAGGSTDIVARLIAQYLTDKLGQSFVVENRPGGGNNIGTEAAARSPADGYTLFMANSVNTINASIYEKLNYNFIADFAPIVNAMTSPLLMMVHPSVAAKTVPEFIAYAKANPDKINMGSGGNGATGHMSGELFKMMAGIKLMHVPYRGEAMAMTDLISGQAQMAFTTTGSAIQYVKAGNVRALAVTSPGRLDALPDVPPLAQFLPGYEAAGWSGLVAPKATPAEIVDKLHREASAALADPRIKQRVIDMGGTVPGGTRAEFARFIAEETEKWGKVAKFANVKVN
jgi:tripartite-type tricarboxylate transporter receptor subunit TctC